MTQAVSIGLSYCSPGAFDGAYRCTLLHGRRQCVYNDSQTQRPQAAATPVKPTAQPDKPKDNPWVRIYYGLSDNACVRLVGMQTSHLKCHNVRMVTAIKNNVA